MTDSVVRSGLEAIPSPLAARRHYLTVLFSDLAGSSQLAKAMEAEIYAELLHALREIYRSVIPRLGGTIVRIQGDGMLAIFGYPHAQEDDGRRATEAALEMHELARRLSLPAGVAASKTIRLHTGIHSGLVLLDEGDVVLGRFELTGEAPNIAAHLSAAASSDEILVSDETLGPERHFFLTSDSRDVGVKDGTSGIRACAILARATIDTRLAARAQRGLVPFIGRKEELRLLDGELRVAIGGVPRYFAITAAAGLGKSRLADEFLRNASELGCEVHRGYCESYLVAEPLQPVLQILRRLFSLHAGMPSADAATCVASVLRDIGAELGDAQEDLLRALSVAVPGEKRGVSRAPAPELVVNSVRDIFDRLAARRPQLVFVDDLQWADDATLKILEALRGLEGRPILVLVATRGFAAGDADMSNAGILELAPLSSAEAAEAIDRLLPGTDPFLSAKIRDYAGGNPLFIEELCHTARFVDADRRLERVPDGPAWLNTLVESRLARLPKVQAELVRVAAVIGTVVPSWLLERLTGCGAEHPLVRRLAQQDVIFPGEQTDTLRFKHAITRDVIYNSVGMRERRDLHLRVAWEIVHRHPAGPLEDSYEALAYHFGAAGQPQEAANYAELAGDKAMAASAFDRAQAQFRAALNSLDQLEPKPHVYQRWLSIVQRLGFSCVFDPAREHLEVFRRAVELASSRRDDLAIAQSEYWLGYINYALGESGVASLHCEHALVAAQASGNAALVAQVGATLGQVRAAACDYDGALELLDEALEAKRRRRSHGRLGVGSAYTLACKGSILGDLGLFEQAHQCFADALEEVRNSGHGVEGSVLCWRAGVHLWQGRWEEARADAAAAQSIAERVSSLYVFAMGRSLGAYANWILQRDEASLERLHEATSWLEERDKGLFISLNYGWLAEGMEATGRPADSRRFAARAIHRARKQDRIGEAMAYRALARLSMKGAIKRPAEHYLEQAVNAARARRSPHELAKTQLQLASVKIQRGDLDQARALLEQASSAFRAMNMTWHLGEASERLGAL